MKERLTGNDPKKLFPKHLSKRENINAFDDPYTYVADYVLRAFDNANEFKVTTYIVTLTIGDYVENNMLYYDYMEGCYVWDNDWYEGESDVIIHGAIDVDNIFISGIIGEVNE